MKKTLFIVLVALMCTRTFAQTENEPMGIQVSMQLVESKNITVSTGAHRVPAKIDIPCVYINNEGSLLYVEKSDMCEGATYRIMDEYDNVVLSGTISFGENSFCTIYLATVSHGNHVLEIETQNYIFGAQLLY
ncbi:MAG: DUF3244 domain-containing protein [Bacteroidaceae bacterium]